MFMKPILYAHPFASYRWKVLVAVFYAVSDDRESLSRVRVRNFPCENQRPPEWRVVFQRLL